MKTNNNFKAMFVGILLIAATFSLMTSNTNGPTVFAQSSNNPRGVEYTVTISDLPKQTADASTVVTLSNNQPDAYFGVASINIPGIGNGGTVALELDNSIHDLTVSIANIPGSTGSGLADIFDSNTHPINIPGIGSGHILIN